MTAMRCSGFVAISIVALSCLLSACSADDSSNGRALDVADANGDAPDDGAPDTSGDLGENRLTVGYPNVVQNPASVLSAFVFVDTSEPAKCAIEYGLDVTYGLRTDTSALSTEHELVVVQMRSDEQYLLRAVCESETGETAISESASFTTGPLPDDMPEIAVTTFDDEQMASGLTAFGPGIGRERTASPYYLAVDEAGEIIWYYQIPQDADRFNDRSLEMLADGNLLITTPQGFSVITIGGETVLDFVPQTSGNTIFHHDAIQIPNGRFLTLSQVVEQAVVEWESDPINVLADIIVELDSEGRETWVWSAFDNLDTTRFPSRLSRQGGRGGSYDWTHANSLFYVEADDSIIVSLRHQNWIVKIDRATGAVIWRLGEDGDFDLTNLAPSDLDAWFYAQHAAKLIDDGLVILYDNGNDRPGLTPSQQYSRGVMYQLDEDAMTVEQTWSHATEHFTNFLGDADLLDNGNALLTAGGADDNGAPAQIIEVTTGDPSEVVWLLELEGNSIYRATRLPSFYLE